MKKLLAVLLTVVFCLAISGLAIAVVIADNDGVFFEGSIDTDPDEGVVNGSGELTFNQGADEGDTLKIIPTGEDIAPPPDKTE